MFKLFRADDHIMEPSNVFTDRVAAKYTIRRKCRRSSIHKTAWPVALQGRHVRPFLSCWQNPLLIIGHLHSMCTGTRAEKRTQDGECRGIANVTITSPTAKRPSQSVQASMSTSE